MGTDKSAPIIRIQLFSCFLPFESYGFDSVGKGNPELHLSGQEAIIFSAEFFHQLHPIIGCAGTRGIPVDFADVIMAHAPQCFLVGDGEQTFFDHLADELVIKMSVAWRHMNRDRTAVGDASTPGVGLVDVVGVVTMSIGFLYHHSSSFLLCAQLRVEIVIYTPIGIYHYYTINLHKMQFD